MRLPKTNLHRAGQKADWEIIPKNKRNVWQHIAASTKGILTPANVMSVIGAVLVFMGLYYIFTDELGWGFVCVAVGRFADLLDGALAQATGTKSSVGEAVDAGLDKIIIFVAIIAFLATGAVPLWAAIIIAVRNVIIMTLGLLGKAHHITLHPSRAGKYAAATEWAAILLFILATAFSAQQWNGAEATAYLTACAFLIITLLFGFTAIKNYARLLTQKHE
jgi:phosphatidylglycerophosphate synthase